MPVLKNTQSGFSLIELLAAVVILAVGLLGLAQLQVTAIKANAQSDSISVANALAQKVVEDIASMPAQDPIFSTNTDPPWADWEGSPFSVSGAGDYNVTYTVATNYQTVTGLSQISIRVRSAGAVLNVLGNKTQSVEAIAFKRSF